VSLTLPLLLQALGGPNQPALPPAPIAITHITIIDTERGSTQSDRIVLIRDGRIAGIESSGVAVPPGGQKIDGRGKFLLPGLWDMHVHLLGDGQPVASARGERTSSCWTRTPGGHPQYSAHSGGRAWRQILPRPDLDALLRAGEEMAGRN
jgi:imidazolonepropionase-like amidohydrolase